MYLLTPYSTVLLGKPTGPQLVKKLPTFYGTRRFIPAFICLYVQYMKALMYLLTPHSRVFFEKPTGPQPVKSPHFMVPEGPFLRSQVPNMSTATSLIPTNFLFMNIT